MEYNKPISDMMVGDHVAGFYILRTASPRVTVAGKPYLNASLSDISGEIEAVAWDYHGALGASDAGSVVYLEGSVSEYRGNRQITIDAIRPRMASEHVNLANLVPTAPIDTDAYFEEVESLVASMEDADYQAVCQEMLSRHSGDLRSIPAAKSVHHAFLSGLLMHTVHMLRIAAFMADLYRDVIDRDLLLAGTLLHDFAKSREFLFSDVGLVSDYSVPGQLLGHLVMGAQEVAEVAKELGIPEEKSILLQHMILSHHGEPEYGAAVRPLCAESEMLSFIDKVDSRMELYRENLEKTPSGGFSERIFALDHRIYRHN